MTSIKEIKKNLKDQGTKTNIYFFQKPNKFANALEFTCYNAQAWRLGTCTYELYNILMSNFSVMFKIGRAHV